MIFSVLIPAHNAGLYIKRCIESILAQTFKSFELIILDDGSTDNTIEICRQYSFCDNRIRILSQHNQGVSISRNYLLDSAIGEWIVFIDADDYISDDYLQTFSTYINNFKADMYICNYYNVKNGILSAGFPNDSKNKAEFICKFLEFKKVNTVMWGKAINRKFIEKYKFRFNKTIDVGEDLLFISELFTHLENIIFIPKKMYYWVKNDFSLTSSNNIKHKNDIVRVFSLIENSFRGRDYYNLYKPFLNKSKLTLLCDFRCSKDNQINQLSYSIFRDLNYKDFKNLNKILLLFLKVDFTLGIKIMKKIVLLF